MQFIIREAKEEDSGSIVELLNPIIEAGTYTILDSCITLDDQVEFFRHFPDEGVFNVAVREGGEGVVGLQDVQPICPGVNAFKHVGEISTFVSLDMQRKGIGRALSRVTFEDARDRGFHKLIATIRADNRDAVSFYKSQGFGHIGVARRHARVRGKYVDEVLMERFLD